MTPTSPKRGDLSLPLMLRTPNHPSMAGCSKAAQGLSVQAQEDRIFTVMSISPSLSLRQCPNRYAFRAGLNLPDKEFRYLRTVIVTAAVHQGFSSKLITRVFNRLALGRRQLPYIVLRLRGNLCF